MLTQDAGNSRNHTSRAHNGHVSSRVSQFVSPVIREIAAQYRSRKIAETRQATRREVAHLPLSLQQDLAFSDGTVIPFDR